MMQVSARELRQRLASVLRRVAAGEEVIVTLRGRPFASLKPLAEASQLDPIGFGMWKGREDLKDVDAWIDQRRAPRQGR